MIKKEFGNFVKRIILEAEECVFLLLDKCILPCDEDVIACFPYIAPEYSTIYKDKIFKGIEVLEQHFVDAVLKYGDLPWLIGGDLNARTGNCDDILESDHLDVFIGGYDDCDYIRDNPLSLGTRCSLDSETNNFG